MENHQQYMRRCYELAEIAKREGESPVGSVVVLHGVVIGEGTEKSRQLRDITRHAEVVAIRQALASETDLQDAILYSNVEPCALCSYVIRHHHIKQVVYSCSSGALGGTSHPACLLQATSIDAWGKPPKITLLPQTNG